ncbi:hypothetical protein PINS_up002079 [Pythium insidiosum]|nr:hypothetical protein PINS_up002079 [Pythium insidiosum]
MFHIASRDAIPPLPPQLSDSARSFLLSCFEKDPSRRPTASDLLRHPFLQLLDESMESIESSLSTEQKTSRLAANDEPSSPASSFSPSNRSASSTMTSPRSEASDAAPTNAEFSSDEEDSARLVPSAAVATVGEDAAAPRNSLVLQPSLGSVRAIANYTATDSSEMSLEDGETVAVVDVNEFGWWRGRREGAVGPEVGWFPCTYVEWQSVEKQFIVRTAHTPSTPGVNRRGSVCERPELAVELNDLVLISQCEWMDERLWALGSLPSGRCGWFPFACVLDTSAPRPAAQR